MFLKYVLFYSLTVDMSVHLSSGEHKTENSIKIQSDNQVIYYTEFNLVKSVDIITVRF